MYPNPFAREPGRPPAPPIPPSPSSPWANAARLTITALRVMIIAISIWFAAVFAAIILFRFVNPPFSMLMATQRLGGLVIEQEWVAIDAISNNLKRAVITSEDGKFCRHWGFDLGEIRAAMKSRTNYGRGASTITQQVAKNLFLWNGKSYIRKALEVPLTLAIETAWPKKRILEVYLNIAEWGPGIFGAQAASQYYFNKSADVLSERESALLAISLPNPIARDASSPNAAIVRRAANLQSQMRVQGVSYCVLAKKPDTNKHDRSPDRSQDDDVNRGAYSNGAGAKKSPTPAPRAEPR